MYKCYGQTSEMPIFVVYLYFIYSFTIKQCHIIILCTVYNTAGKYSNVYYNFVVATVWPKWYGYNYRFARAKAEFIRRFGKVLTVRSSFVLPENFRGFPDFDFCP